MVLAGNREHDVLVQRVLDQNPVLSLLPHGALQHEGSLVLRRRGGDLNFVEQILLRFRVGERYLGPRLALTVRVEGKLVVPGGQPRHVDELGAGQLGLGVVAVLDLHGAVEPLGPVEPVGNVQHFHMPRLGRGGDLHRARGHWGSGLSRNLVEHARAVGQREEDRGLVLGALLGHEEGLVRDGVLGLCVGLDQKVLRATPHVRVDHGLDVPVLGRSVLDDDGLGLLLPDPRRELQDLALGLLGDAHAAQVQAQVLAVRDLAPDLIHVRLRVRCGGVEGHVDLGVLLGRDVALGRVDREVVRQGSHRPLKVRTHVPDVLQEHSWSPCSRRRHRQIAESRWRAGAPRQGSRRTPRRASSSSRCTQTRRLG
mmetsp:Transcript_4790/g.17189  ORF Transcript_4790/g.17189 Transcript_4790/m.17189 type:complete len:368 (-) Transcript_4790:7703-8806(-)